MSHSILNKIEFQHLNLNEGLGSFKAFINAETIPDNAKLLYLGFLFCRNTEGYLKEEVKKVLGWNDTDYFHAERELVEGDMLRHPIERDGHGVKVMLPSPLALSCLGKVQ